MSIFGHTHLTRYSARPSFTPLYGKPKGAHGQAARRAGDAREVPREQALLNEGRSHLQLKMMVALLVVVIFFFLDAVGRMAGVDLAPTRATDGRHNVCDASTIST